MLFLRKIAKKNAFVVKSLTVLAIGSASLGMTGCIDQITAGITSNLCVLEGECNGSTKM